MKYTIKDAAEKLAIPASTIRYYDKKGLIPNLEYDANGVRIFNDEVTQWLRIVSCFLKTGMKISNLQNFVQLGLQGEKTIEERRNILLRQRERLAERQKELDEAKEVLEIKLKDYFDIGYFSEVEGISCVQLHVGEK